MPRARRFFGALTRCAGALLALASIAHAAGDEAAGSWLVVGRQGLVQFVIVPAPQATDAAAYDAELAKICAAGETCFVNFYTNTSGAEPKLPLPDAIADEATATFRRSMKNGVQMLRWSCRLKVDAAGECF